MNGPTPTPEQALRVLQILGEWTRRGFYYDSGMVNCDVLEHAVIGYTNPGYDPDSAADANRLHLAFGANHFDALCQATTAMQALLELHPEKP